MALENLDPVTRLEAILDGEDITPVTRLEYFLKQAATNDDELPAVTAADNGDVLTVVSGEWAKAAAPSGLPEVTSSNNGQVLTVVNGEWAAANTKDAPVAEISYTATYNAKLTNPTFTITSCSMTYAEQTALFDGASVVKPVKITLTLHDTSAVDPLTDIVQTYSAYLYIAEVGGGVTVCGAVPYIEPYDYKYDMTSGDVYFTPYNLLGVTSAGTFLGIIGKTLIVGTLS